MARARFTDILDVTKLDLRVHPKPYSLRSGLVINPYRGILRVQAKPHPPKRPPTQKQKLWRDWLKATAWAWRYLPADVKEQYRQLARPPWQYPRDIFTAAVAGTLFAFADEHGNQYYPARWREAVSEVLDIVSYKVGALLVRGEHEWIGLEPGPEGYVLTSNGQEQVPEWRPVPTSSVGGDTRPNLPPHVWRLVGGSTLGYLSAADFIEIPIIDFPNSGTPRAATSIDPTLIPNPFRVQILVASSTALSGNAVFEVAVNALDLTNPAPTPTTTTVIVPGPGAEGVTAATTTTSFTIPSGAVLIALRITRLASHADDTLTSAAPVPLVRIVAG